MKVIPQLGVSLYSNENKLGRQSSPPINSACDNKERVIRLHQAASKMQTMQTKKMTKNKTKQNKTKQTNKQTEPGPE